jgi:hypothetical protein
LGSIRKGKLGNVYRFPINFGSLFPLAYDRPDGAFFPFGGGNAVAEPIPNKTSNRFSAPKKPQLMCISTRLISTNFAFSYEYKYIKNSKNLHPT